MKNTSKKSLILKVTALVVLLLAAGTIWRVWIVSPVFIFESYGGEHAEIIINGKSYGQAPVTLSHKEVASLLASHRDSESSNDDITVQCSATDIFTDYSWQFGIGSVNNNQRLVNVFHGYVSLGETGSFQVDVVGADGVHKKITGVRGSIFPSLEQRFWY